MDKDVSGRKYGTTVRTERVKIPGSSSATFNRIYIQADGDWIEIVRVFDCERHYTTREEKPVELCVDSGEPVQIDEKLLRKCGATKVCMRHCKFKKKQFSELMEDECKWPYIREESMEYIRKFLEAEDEIC